MAAEDYIDLSYHDLEDTLGPSGKCYSPNVNVSNPDEAWEDDHLSCQGRPRLRTNRQTGEPFWGCSHYPECRHTIPYEDGDPRWNGGTHGQ